MAKFKMNKFYYFHYDPKLKETLPFYDKRPLVFPLNRRGATFLLALNLHFIPQRHKKKFVEWLIDLSLKVRSRKKFTQITYSTIKNTPALKPALKGIRLYINRRATNLIEIDKDDVQDFFIPKLMNKQFLRKHRAKKVYKK